MSDLQKELDAIAGLEQKAGTTQESAQKTRVAAQKKMEALCKRIRGGETTGNRIRDFVIVARGGSPNPEQEKLYQELEEKISKHTGEFILVIGRSWESSGLVSFHGKSIIGHGRDHQSYYLKEEVILGILDGKKLVFNLKDHPQCQLPTSKYAHPWIQGKIEATAGNIKDSCAGGCFYWSISQLNAPARARTQYGKHIEMPMENIYWDPDSAAKDTPNLQLEIKVGDVEVDAWFIAHKRRGQTYEKLQKALGRIAIETPENKKRQKQTLTALARLTGERMRIVGNLQDVFLHMHRQYESSDEHGIWLPREQHPWEAALKDYLQELTKVELQIASEVKEALELDLGHIESIKKLAKQYEVKT